MPEEDNLVIEATPFQRPKASQGRSLIRVSPLTVSVTLVFVVLAIAALFMFTARAVRFDISPTPEEFSVTEGLFNYQLGERYLMLPGEYGIAAGASGYYDLTETIEVSSDSDQTLTFELQKLPGILAIRTSPATSASVMIDQQTIGVTPLIVDEVAAGVHDISVTTERYFTFDTEVEIEGKRQQQELIAELIPAWANITVTTLPEGADIFVDDIQAGISPESIEAIEGRRTLSISKPGYKTWQTVIDVAAGEDQIPPTVRLEKSDGRISISSKPAGANISIGGRYFGQTPLDVTLPPANSYDILLTRAGYQNVKRVVDIKAEEDISVFASLSPVIGNIHLSVEPPGGELFIDGQSRGEPNQQLTLTASKHALEIRLDGYATYQTDVTPQPGLTQRLLVQLQTEEEAKIAAIPPSYTSNGDVDFTLILPGDLSMGAGRREPGRRSNEIEKQVALTQAYYLGIREISNARYKQFDSAHDSGVLGRSLLSQQERPVVNVSWYGAIQYCNCLSDQDGLPRAYQVRDGEWRAVSPMNNGYRLPTEAEWAYAARYAAGPTPLRFPWGNNMPPTEVHANYADESAASMVPYTISDYHDNYRGPAPVGTYAANEFGLYDLAGNVSEWMHDYYSIALAREPLTDPLGPDEGEFHVIRGSNYTHGRFSELRWTYRDFGRDPRPDVGFRVARYVDDVEGDDDSAITDNGETE
jgi:formylglycine-generating enzyme required for sulfatase activity